jgi:hypothetical protein
LNYLNVPLDTCNLVAVVLKSLKITLSIIVAEGCYDPLEMYDNGCASDASSAFHDDLLQKKIPCIKGIVF